MDLDQFTAANAPTDSAEPFQRENSYTLDVDVDGTVMAKAGSMVAYTGDVSFTGKASAEGGLKGFLKEATTGEGTPIMAVEGEGHVYFADDGKKVQVVELGAGESITERIDRSPRVLELDEHRDTGAEMLSVHVDGEPLDDPRLLQPRHAVGDGGTGEPHLLADGTE